MTSQIRVVLAEDHAMVRAGMTRLLQDIPGVEVVAVAVDGREAVELVAQHRPDIALLDITMPGLSGLNALTRIRADQPEVRVIMLSMHDNEEYVGHALKAGAAGYLLKGSSFAELELALRSVMSGGSYLTPAVSRHVIRDFTQRSPREPGVYERLTPRQSEIVQLIAEGHRNAEIGAIL
ncbi:MAG TPA: response regulator transcription factor, partial [Candidatus Limnocylindrales bacterium]|nr:response regulator transcription factor [Candidatus Limnocylindrales bacterium]